jgi:isoleucyl-tRNA synthetase
MNNRYEMRNGEEALLEAKAWSEVAIVSKYTVDLTDAKNALFGYAILVEKACGEKCARCWRVLEEVGSVSAHPTLCLRCADAVDSGLVGPSAA